MSNRIFALAVFVFLTVSVSAIIVHAQDADEEAGVKSHGVVHNIADDREIERIGGVYQPEGLDKYMKRKFDAMSAQISKLEAKVDELQEAVRKINTMPGRRQGGALVSTSQTQTPR